MINLVKNNWISFALTAGALFWGFSQANGLPDLLPTHFDLQGNPNQFQSKYFVLFFLPAVSIFVTVLLGFIARISPEGYTMPDSEGTASKFASGITAFMMVLYVGMILQGRDPHAFQKIMIPDFALFMIFIGNYFGKLERNFFVGIRVPWTLASPENWKHTHRFSGKVFVVLGCAALVSSFFHAPIWTIFFFLIAASVLCVGYSYYYFSKFERGNRVNQSP